MTPPVQTDEATSRTGTHGRGIRAFLAANRIWWLAPLIAVFLVAVVVFVAVFGFGVQIFVYPLF